MGSVSTGVFVPLEFGSVVLIVLLRVMLSIELPGSTMPVMFVESVVFVKSLVFVVLSVELSEGFVIIV